MIIYSSLGLFLPVIFVLVFAAVYAFVFYKGENIFRRIFWYGKVIKDYGYIGKTSVLGLPQTVRLLKMIKGEEDFFLLEKGFLIGFVYVKISNEMAKNLISTLSSNLN